MLEGKFVTSTQNADNTNTENTIQLKKDKHPEEENESLIKLQYNDKIQAYTKGSDVLGALKEFSSLTKSNLLYVYVSDYLPLLASMCGTTSVNQNEVNYKDKILTFVKDNIDNIKIEANTAFTLDFTYGTKEEKQTEFSVNYAPDAENNLLDITIKNMTYNNCVGDITFSILKGFDNSKSTSFKSTSDIGYVDLTTLPLLMKVGIQTTNRHDYEMSGTLKLKTGAIASLILKADITAAVTIHLRVGTDLDSHNLFTVKAIIEIVNKGEETKPKAVSFDTEFIKHFDMTSTKFYIKDTDAYIHQQRNTLCSKGTKKKLSQTWSWGEWYTGSIKDIYLKTTQEQMVNDMMYYIFDFSLDAKETLEQIQKFIGMDIDMDFLSLFKYFKLVNENGVDFYQALLQIATIKVYADLYYNHEQDEFAYTLDRLHIHSSFDILIASINIDLDVTNKPIVDATYYDKMVSTSDKLSEYDSFFIDWENNPNLKNLEYRYSKDLFDLPYYYSTTTNLS